LLAALLALSAGLEAQEAEPPRSWKRRIENTFAFVLNPLGIQNALEISWTRSITRSERLVVKDAHVAMGVSSKLTPAFERVGAWFEYSPLSVIDLRVGVEPVYYFGTYKAFLPFNRIDARFDDDLIEQRRDEAASGFAGRVYAAPTLKARAGAMVARVKAEYSWWKAQKNGEPFFYEPAWDTLIGASGSRVLTLEGLLLREFKLSRGKTLLLGPVYDLTSVNDARVNRKQDLGLLAAWSKTGRFLGVKDPAIALKAVYFIEDPWRRREAGAQFAFVFGL
jgi:hypothetical protein